MHRSQAGIKLYPDAGIISIIHDGRHAGNGEGHPIIKRDGDDLADDFVRFFLCQRQVFDGRIHVHRRTVIQSYHSGDKRAAFEDEIIPVWGNGKPFQKPFHDIVAYDDHSLVAVAFGHIAN